MKTRQAFIPIGPSIAYVPLTQGLYSLIDSRDAGILSQWNWCASEDSEGSFYAKRIQYSAGGLRTRISIQRLLTECPSGLIADHVNGNTLDNRRCNLRVVTAGQSAMNRGSYRTNKSGCPGVFWDKRINKYTAQIQAQCIMRLLGYFENYEDAVAAYREAKRQLFGEYGRAA